MRVCFVSPTGSSGGGERSMLDLIDTLSIRGVECRVVVPASGYVSRALEARGVEYTASHFRTWCSGDRFPVWDRVLKKPAAHLVRGARLARMIRPWKCDVVVTNTLSTCEGAIGARLLRIPHITHVREFGDLDHGWHFEFGPQLSMRILSALSRLVVFNSRAVARRYARQVPQARIRIVYNSVTVPTMPPRERPGASRVEGGHPFHCVFVGAVTESKGPEEAIRAVHEAIRRGLPVRLTIVGAGPQAYVAYLRSLIESLGLRESVEMVGHAEDPLLFFREADVALVCSRAEAFGRVILEAMKMGTPVIGANTGGTPESIRDGFNGALYSAGSAKDLADKIELLCKDRELARRMGGQAQAWATQTFNPERYGKEMLAVLAEVTGGAGLLSGTYTTAGGHEQKQRRRRP
jgi:glycosyltransferase involved in cell wall biosynthesis